MNPSLTSQAEKARNVKLPVEKLIWTRWSPRCMSGEPLTETELATLFEAARWAPSSYNNQPWRFLFTKPGSSDWALFFEPLIPFNQSWVAKASILMVAVSAKLFTHNNKPARTHSFDTGAAWMALALQGWSMGLVVHGMEGFDEEKIRRNLEIPEDHQIEAMIAVGKPGDLASMTPELKEREIASSREPTSSFAYSGKFRKK